ncbi:MAG: hypothetical protein AB8G96_16550 [Phycisphaerales bacterium]
MNVFYQAVAAFLMMFTLVAQAHAQSLDCQFTGEESSQLTEVMRTTDVSSSWVTDVCEDGTLIYRYMQTEYVTALMCRTTTKFMESPDGTDCLPVVERYCYWELVSSSVLQTAGEYCWEDFRDECCALVGTEWEFESGGTEIDRETRHEDYLCPDGQMGVRSTVIKTYFVKRRVMTTYTYENVDPTGPCEGIVCGTLVAYGPWEWIEERTETEVTIYCPEEPEEPGQQS